MTISAAAASAACLCFAALTVWAGIMDLTTLKIRNKVVVLLLAVYVALAPLAGFGAVEIGVNAVVAAGVLAAMFVFFSLGWIGGGDAKFSAVAVLWLGAEHAVPYVLYMAVFGGVLTLALIQFRLTPLPAYCLRVPWIMKLHSSGSGVPYGIAITSAALFVFPDTPWLNALT